MITEDVSTRAGMTAVPGRKVELRDRTAITEPPFGIKAFARDQVPNLPPPASAVLAALISSSLLSCTMSSSMAKSLFIGDRGAMPDFMAFAPHNCCGHRRLLTAIHLS